MYSRLNRPVENRTKFEKFKDKKSRYHVPHRLHMRQL